MQATSFQPTLGVVPYDGGGPAGLPLTGTAKQRDGEGDREAMTVAVQRRYLEELIAVLRLTCGHGLPVAGPVSVALAIRDDDVERLSDRVGGGPSEEALGSVVPEHDCAFGIGDHDGVGEVAHETGPRIARPLALAGVASSLLIVVFATALVP